MTKKKTSAQRSPWIAVTVGLLGLVVGYSFVIGSKGQMAFAGSVSCPMKKEVCTGADCNKNILCASGICNHDCPGNCKHSG